MTTFTPKNIRAIADALKSDAAGNQDATMTDLDLAYDMLDELAYRVEREQFDEAKLAGARDQASAQMGSITELVAALQCDYERLEELKGQKVPRYVAGWNMPGYMPDMEPAEFDDPDDAMEFIKDEAKRVVDDDESLPDDVAKQQTADIDEFWKATPQGEFGQTFGDYHYWVTQDGTMGLDEDELKELAELEAAAGDCEDADDARQRIEEGPLEIQVRSDWHTPGEPAEPTEFMILLCTGGPAVRIVGELDEHLQPCRAWIEYQDWFTPFVEYHGDNADQDTLLAYCQCFCFGE